MLKFIKNLCKVPQVKTDFDLAFEEVLLQEGGATYTNHPADKGGPTKYGITQKTLSDWRKKPCSADDVKNLTEEEAKRIYKTQYWDSLKLDQVGGLKASLIFDQAVNRGVSVVAVQVQRLIGVHPDGIFGPKTIQALKDFPMKDFGFQFFKAAQKSYIEIVIKNPSQLVFLRGWMNRTYSLLEMVIKQ